MTHTALTPTSAAEVVEHHLPQLANITFTGSLAPALDLDRRCPGRKKTWARKIATALSALDTYASAHHQGDPLALSGFWNYCRSGAAPIAHHQVCLQESKKSMQRWPEERRFPVPTSVDPLGETHMSAHIRIDTCAPVAPRVYYLDRVATGHGVLVGYIGPHLTTGRV